MIDRDRILMLLHERTWTQATLARALDVSPSAIQQILSGKTRNTRLLPQMAELLEVSQEYITGVSNDRSKPVSGDITPEMLVKALKSKVLNYSPELDKLLTDDPDFKSSLYNDVYNPYWVARQVARVSPELFEQKGSSYHPVIHSHYMSTDAMSPTLMRGDHLLVSVDSRTVSGPDGIWAIRYGGLGMVRRLMPLPNGAGYRVSADNPAAPTFEASAADIELKGIVFWVGRMIS